MRYGLLSKAAGTSLLAFLVVVMTVVVLMPPPAAAEGGDFQLDFIAAEPYSYDHGVGGGAYDDRTIGVDVVESLQGGDFRCGDIVTYLLLVENAPDPSDPVQTAQFSFSFSADTTGQSGAAHKEVVGVGINYGVIAWGVGDGTGGTDDGIEDDHGSAASIVSTGLTGPPYSSGSELLLTVQVDDLEAAESVVLRIDTRISCQPYSRPTGNLQGALTDARVIAPVQDPISSGSGEQTINFKKIGDLIRSTITVIKVADPEQGTFEFTLAGPEFIDVQTISGDYGSYWWSGLFGGVYSLTELVPDGWVLDEIDCGDANWTDAPGGASITLSESQEEDVVCTFWDSQDRGTIIVDKVTDPAGGTGFEFEGSFDNFVLDDGQMETFRDLLAGIYAVSEIVPEGWRLDSATCDDGSDPDAIELGAGETVHCTFTNERLGEVIIVKETVPAGGIGFDFTGDLGLFSLDDGKSESFAGLVAGTYGVAEAVPDGWDLTDATCDDGSEPGAIDLAAGETVTCTFVNTHRGRIIVEKRTDPAQMPDTFVFSPSYGEPFTLADGEKNDSGPLVPDEYAVSELVPDGWVLEGVECDSEGVRETEDGVTIDLAAGETVHCVFNDHQLRGSIEVIKTTDPESAEDFEFTLAPGTTRAVSGSAGSTTWSNLLAGDYSLTETLAALQEATGWTSVSATCDNGDDPDAITLDPGEHVVCKFHNVQALSSITVVKTTEPTTTQNFVFTLDGDEVSVGGDGGSYTWIDVEGGRTYSLTEALSAAQVTELWSLDSVSCESELESGVASIDNGVDIDLLPGDHVTCTFRNVQELGSITVVKKTAPADAQGFSFTLDPGDAQIVAGDGGSYTWDELVPGSYDLSESLTAAQVAAGWYIESATCDKDDDPGEIDLDPGEDVTCTFWDYKTSDFILEKETDVETDAEFTFVLDGAEVADLGAGETFEMTLETGTYTIRELMVEGWELVDVSCVGAEPDVDLGTGAASLFIPPGSTVTCVFENHEIPALLGAIGDFVWLDVDGNGLQDPSEVGVEGMKVELVDAATKMVVTETTSDANGIYILANVPEGDYYLRFTTPPGWEFTDPNMGDDNRDSDAVFAEEVAASTGGPGASAMLLAFEALKQQVGVTAQFHLAAGSFDMSLDAGILRVKVLPQVITTTSTTSGTLPFTGDAGGPSLAGLAMALLALGGMTVLSLRRREDQPIAGWSARLPQAH